MPPKKQASSSEAKPGKRTLVQGALKGNLVFNGGYLGLNGEIVEDCCDKHKEMIEKHVPRDYVKKKEERDKGGHHHITLMLKQDVKKAIESLPSTFPSLIPANATASSLTIEDLLNVMEKTLDLSDLKPLGIGRVAKSGAEALFVVVEWPSANQFLNTVGADKRDFHVTLGFKDKDIHGVAKNQTTLLKE